MTLYPGHILITWKQHAGLFHYPGCTTLAEMAIERPLFATHQLSALSLVWYGSSIADDQIAVDCKQRVGNSAIPNMHKYNGVFHILYASQMLLPRFVLLLNHIIPRVGVPRLFNRCPSPLPPIPCLQILTPEIYPGVRCTDYCEIA
jgi:hypothetical protein